MVSSTICSYCQTSERPSREQQKPIFFNWLYWTLGFSSIPLIKSSKVVGSLLKPTTVYFLLNSLWFREKHYQPKQYNLKNRLNILKAMIFYSFNWQFSFSYFSIILQFSFFLTTVFSLNAFFILFERTHVSFSLLLQPTTFSNFLLT